MNTLSTVTTLTEEFGYSWYMIAAQLVNLLVIIVPFILATIAILKKGSGLEKPTWIFLCFVVPIIFPIIALIHFRKSKA